MGRDAVVWRESPSAVLGRHYSDGTKTQHGVSCCVWGLVRTVRPHVWGLGVCLGRDAVVWRESPSAVLGTHYGDVIETRYGVSCTG